MIFNNIEQKILDELIKKINIKTKEYFRGEIICHEDELCDSIAIIKRGNIKATKSYSDGHEKIIKLLNQNEIIGLSLIFSSHPYYKASFTAECLTTLVIINKDDLLFLMDNNLNIKLNILSYISDNSIRLNDHIKLLSYKTIRQKLCAFLYNEYKTKNASSFLIQYTKTELSAFLNVERPSLSFELSKLVSDGIIANQNKLYTIIDINRLEKEI